MVEKLKLVLENQYQKHQNQLSLFLKTAIFAVALFFVIAMDGMISRIDSILFSIIFWAYIVYTIRVSRKEAHEVKEEYKEFFRKRDSITKDIVLIAAGLAALFVGAEILVMTAISLARTMGISELIIIIG